MPSQPRSQISSQITGNLPTNGTEFITAAALRAVLETINSSLVNQLDERSWFKLTHQTTRAYEPGDVVLQAGALYQCAVATGPGPFSKTAWVLVATFSGSTTTIPLWDNAVSYADGAVVQWQARIWEALQATQGQAPTDFPHSWRELSAESSFGDPYEVGTYYPEGSVVRTAGNLWQQLLKPGLIADDFDTEVAAGHWQALVTAAGTGPSEPAELPAAFNVYLTSTFL